MGYKHLLVKKKTHQELKIFIAKSGLRSVDDAIRRLLNNVES